MCLLLIRSLEGVWTHQTQKVEGRRGGWDRWKIHDGFDPFRAAAAFHFRSLGLRPTKRPQPNPTARNQSPTRTKLKRTQQTKRNTREEEKKKKEFNSRNTRVCEHPFTPSRLSSSPDGGERTNERTMWMCVCACVRTTLKFKYWRNERMVADDGRPNRWVFLITSKKEEKKQNTVREYTHTHTNTHETEMGCKCLKHVQERKGHWTATATDGSRERSRTNT